MSLAMSQASHECQRLGGLQGADGRHMQSEDAASSEVDAEAGVSLGMGNHHTRRLASHAGESVLNCS